MNNKVKLLIIALVIIIPVLIPVIMQVNPVSGIFTPTETNNTNISADVAASYKTKCAACHSPKAEKLFDPEKPIEEHVEIILKGKKGEKPPFMPGYESKGMTAEEAKALAEYMISLRKPSS